ncbi:MAG: hypothetical protein AAFX05_06885 [Planctomycetota bacterium]
MQSKTYTLIALASLVATGHAVAGPLSPPAGPIGSSGPTLLQVADLDPLADLVDDIDQQADELTALETRIDVLSLPGDASNTHIITQPGSYYLSDDIIVTAADTNGIQIDADNVTLDLSGRQIIGANLNDASRGITGSTTLTRLNVVVRNGTIRDFQHPVFARLRLSRLESLTMIRSVVSGSNVVVLGDSDSNMVIGCQIQAAGTAGQALVLSNTYAHVIAETHCRVVPIGPNLGRGSAVRDCTVTTTTLGNGLRGDAGSVFRRCSVRDIAGQGFTGLSAGGGNIFVECNAQDCGTDGFDLVLSMAFNCLAQSCGANGFELGLRNYLYECTAIDSDDHGFLIETQGSRVEACHAETISGVPANYGFLALQQADSCLVIKNTAVNAFTRFNDISINFSSFAPEWFDVTLAGPWDNLSQ